MQTDAIAAKNHAISHACMKKIGDVSEVYCIRCYQTDVVQALDASVTFEELLQSKADGPSQTRGISIAGDCKKFVNNFLHECKMKMSIDEYNEWLETNRKYSKRNYREVKRKSKTKKEWTKYVAEREEYVTTKLAYRKFLNYGIHDYVTV